jgi:hypothetical protein
MRYFSLRYNQIHQFSKPVEFALCKEDIDKINELVKLGEDTYDWSSPGKNVYSGAPENGNYYAKYYHDL